MEALELKTDSRSLPCSLINDGALQHLIHHVLFINIVILGAKHRHKLSTCLQLQGLTFSRRSRRAEHRALEKAARDRSQLLDDNARHGSLDRLLDLSASPASS